MIRAQVTEDFASFGVAVLISQHDPESGRRIETLRPVDGSLRWETVARGEQIEPTLRLGHEEASALLAALANHYQGVDDQRALRKDYDAERSRVDKLIDAVTTIAQTPRPVVVATAPSEFGS